HRVQISRTPILSLSHNRNSRPGSATRKEREATRRRCSESSEYTIWLSISPSVPIRDRKVHNRRTETLLRWETPSSSMSLQDQLQETSSIENTSSLNPHQTFTRDENYSTKTLTLLMCSSFWKALVIDATFLPSPSRRKSSTQFVWLILL